VRGGGDGCGCWSWVLAGGVGCGGFLGDFGGVWGVEGGPRGGRRTAGGMRWSVCLGAGVWVVSCVVVVGGRARGVLEGC